MSLSDLLIKATKPLVPGAIYHVDSRLLNTALEMTKIGKNFRHRPLLSRCVGAGIELFSLMPFYISFQSDDSGNVVAGVMGAALYRNFTYHVDSFTLRKLEKRRTQ